MGHEEIGQRKPFLHLHQKIEDLRLYGKIERRNRLVADDQFRLENERPGNADALALAAGKLVRIAVECIRRQTHLRDDRLDDLTLLRPVADAVHLQRPGKDGSHRLARIERREWVLKDHLDAAADAAQAATTSSP